MEQIHHRPMSDSTRNHFEQIIIDYWNATSEKEKKYIELDCYMLFKCENFSEEVINYLNNNGAEFLANEMRHVLQIYQKVPHTHEKVAA